MFKKIFVKIVSDKLVQMVFSPGGKISSPWFLSLFLLQCTCIWVVSCIIHSHIVILPLALYLFIKLFRARLSPVRGGKGLAIASAIIMALNLTEILLIDHTFIYYIPPQLLFHQMGMHVPELMQLVIFLMPFVFIMMSFISLAIIVLITIFPRGKKEWRDWAAKNIRPIFSFSGKIGRIPFLYVVFVVKMVLVVSSIILLVLIYFVSRGDFRDLFMYNPIIAGILLFVFAAVIITALIAMLGVLLRRLRDLGRSVPALFLYVLGTVLVVIFNPFSTMIFPQFFYGISDMYSGFFLSQYLGPVIATFGFGVRVLWACMVFYIAMYPGLEKDRL
jgi:uncharacterized membrane protein YhaH (DUF805 family)